MRCVAIRSPHTCLHQQQGSRRSRRRSSGRARGSQRQKRPGSSTAVCVSPTTLPAADNRSTPTRSPYPESGTAVAPHVRLAACCPVTLMIDNERPQTGLASDASCTALSYQCASLSPAQQPANRVGIKHAWYGSSEAGAYGPATSTGSRGGYVSDYEDVGIGCFQRSPILECRHTAVPHIPIPRTASHRSAHWSPHSFTPSFHALKFSHARGGGGRAGGQEDNAAGMYVCLRVCVCVCVYVCMCVCMCVCVCVCVVCGYKCIWLSAATEIQCETERLLSA